MDRYTLLGNYKAARSTLIIAVVLTGLNCVMLMLNLDFSFPYSAVLPQLGLVFMEYGSYINIPPILIVIMFTIIPLALFAISYVLSKNNYKWLVASTALFGIDMIVLIAFWSIVTKFDSGFFLNIAFEGIIIFQMLKGVKAGKDLKNDFTEAESPEQKLANDNTKVYVYNKEFAKANHADKTLPMIVCVCIFFGLLFASIFIVAIVSKINNTLAMLSFFGISIGSIVFLLISLFKFLPFTGASAYAFYKIDGVVYRKVRAYNGGTIPFTNLKVEDETECAYNCSYVDLRGKKRSLVIAKAYPDIEEIIK